MGAIFIEKLQAGCRILTLGEGVALTLVLSAAVEVGNQWRPKTTIFASPSSSGVEYKSIINELINTSRSSRVGSAIGSITIPDPIMLSLLSERGLRTKGHIPRPLPTF